MSAHPSMDVLTAHFDHETPVQECPYCEVVPMLRDIHAAWQNGSETIARILWSLQDGYGEPGYMPAQGYDWSGIRDSSPDAIRRMYDAIHA